MLQTRSKKSRPDKRLLIKGPLHESALGAIHFANYLDSDEPLIVKTIDLEEQNIYCANMNNKRAIVRGLHSSKVVFISNSKSETKEWIATYRPELTLSKIAYIMGPEKNGILTIRTNEFLGEALVGLIVSENVKVPHIVRTRDLWIEDSMGHILQDYGGTSMYKHMASLSFEEFKSAIMQCLVTLSICQKKVALKHHDLHLDNVFLTTMKADDPLMKSDHWSYDLYKPDGQIVKITLKHHGILAKIGDFGLASATDPVSMMRIERADFHILDAGDAEWGQWCPLLEGHEAYDVLVLLSKFFLEEERSLCSVRQAAWARGAYDAIRLIRPEIECSVIGRPLRNQDGGTLSIAEILESPYFNEFRDHVETSIKLN